MCPLGPLVPLVPGVGLVAIYRPGPTWLRVLPPEPRRLGNQHLTCLIRFLPAAEASAAEVVVGVATAAAPITRAVPASWTSGSVPPGRLPRNQSRHHSQTLPCISCSPQAFGFLRPTRGFGFPH